MRPRKVAGAASVGLHVGCYTIDDNLRRCVQPFTYIAPCKASTGGTFSFDTRRVPRGVYRLVVRVTDATGTNSDTSSPVTVTTPGGECAATPRSGNLRFRAGFGRRLRSRATIRYGRRPLIRGRLADRAGRPLARASLCVMTKRRKARARFRKRATVTTDARGRFRYRLRRGGSRRVRFVYRMPGVGDAADVRVRVLKRARR